MRKLLIALLILPTTVFASGITGFWKGELYSFTFYPTQITGNWGTKIYNIEIWPNELDGALASEAFKIEFWNPDITGKLPCGEVKVEAWVEEVNGVICGNSFISTVGHQEESNLVAYDSVISMLIADFPIPAQGMIRRHLDEYGPHH